MENIKNSKNLCTFINLFTTRVILLENKKRNEAIMQRKQIYIYIINEDLKNIHKHICLILRNEIECLACNILIGLCNELISLLNSKNNNSDIKKRCIRNIFYCANKLNIGNTESLRLYMIKYFGSKFIEDIETNYVILDKNICKLINKYTFTNQEIRDMINKLQHEMGIPINNKIEQYFSTFCTISKTNFTLSTLSKHESIISIAQQYSEYAENIYDAEKKEILAEIEKKLILT
ncbi:conserved Plasmodium protein, unknown function [Plasmodium vinckei brucechwatti]|uniref:Uncharacterized protein n=1 Tax=Plasmodium vinckei brucechwatti TaxID=119398 RepID=A0A6V7S536_PLAVN|nr:conserved Plasmodium protein, unknown function [Plasmodium vinckei brucechwatti]